MIETEPAVTSLWAFMASWFTPAVIFCVLNLMIGTLFIISNLKHHNNKQQQQQHSEDDSLQLVRTPSFLERVRSFNFSLYRSEHHVEDDALQLVRTPSLLQRVRSINLSLHRSEHHDPLNPDTHRTDQTVVQSPSTDPGDQDHHVIRSKSEATGKSTPVMIPEKMKRLASEMSVVAGRLDDKEVADSQPAGTAERENETTTSSGEDKEVDAKADDFISRFKHQLKLQRLDSILRYKEMLKRGT